jgi:tetratricopeptide (TPR) repeat protein
MVACTKCSLPNTLDSMFCRKCGTELSADSIALEQDKLKEIITKGMVSFQAGNTEEALAIADHGILTNPSYSEAYALRGMVKEQTGNYAEALDAFETVVSLNPDSTIDKIKLNQLRNAFAARSVEPAPDKKRAGIMALAAGLFVVAGSGITYSVINSNKITTTVPVASQTQPAAPKIKTFDAPVTSQILQPQTPQTSTLGANDVAPIGGQKPANDTPEPRTASRTNLPSTSQERLPTTRRPRGNSGGSGGGGFAPSGFEVTPIDPSIEGGIGKQPKENGKTLPPNNSSSNPVDPAPQPQKPSGDPAPAPETKSTYDVSISDSKAEGRKGNDALSKTGRERMKSGDSEGAAKAYGKAGGSGRNYMRQAQALARQGKSSEAASAYGRAIDAFQSELSNGGGDSDSIRTSLAVCRQALRNLKN